MSGASAVNLAWFCFTHLPKLHQIIITVGIADIDMLQYKYLQSGEIKFQLLLQTFTVHLEVFCVECEKPKTPLFVNS